VSTSLNGPVIFEESSAVYSIDFTSRQPQITAATLHGSRLSI